MSHPSSGDKNGITKLLPDIEVVADKVHQAWILSKQVNGVTSRKAEDGEELMVSYRRLSEKAKELDRATVRAVYVAINASVAQSAELHRVWLWKNFVDGRPEYWAFDNPYPCHENGDPMTLGEPCGYAIVKASKRGRNDASDAEVIAEIKRASARSASGDRNG